MLHRYDVEYFRCSVCGFVQSENPYWLSEAYEHSITLSDTGVMARNLYLCDLASLAIFFFFERNGKFLDFSGGYGLLTRMMRDVGFDFFWHDKYSPNLVARLFEYDGSMQIDLVTSFEAFEHFDQPIAEIENILKINRNILFSTELIPDQVPNPTEWWYYGFEHGQHISFYSRRSLEYIAEKYQLNLYSYGRSLHLLTEKKIGQNIFSTVLKLRRFGLFKYVKLRMKSKTVDDMYMARARMLAERSSE